MLRVVQTFALLHPVECAQQPTLSSIHLHEYSSSIWEIPAHLRTHLKLKANEHHLELEQKMIKCNTEAFEGKGNLWPTKGLMHCNPKWLYCKEDLSALLKSLMLCFAACGARHHLSFLAKMGTSLRSPTECQNWKLPQQFYAKGPKSQRLGVFHWMWVHTHSSFFFFFLILQLTFSSVMGLFFPFLICKMVALACTKQLNTSLAALFIWIQ